MKLKPIAILCFIIMGAFLGIFMIMSELTKRSENSSIDEVPVAIVGEIALPDNLPNENALYEYSPEESGTPVPFPVERIIKNSDPLDLGEIISGVQGQICQFSETEDQIRLSNNVVRDFGEMLDSEIRNPDSVGNQEAKEKMVQMLLSRPASTKD